MRRFDAPTAEPARGGPLFAGRGRERTAARRRAGRIFAALTFVPVVLALLFVAVLLFDVVTDTVSWQVARPANSGETFAWWQAPFGGERVARLELMAQGLSAVEIEEVLGNDRSRRIFFARNRIELMWYAADGPFRWVVTSTRDETVQSYPLLEGIGRVDELRSGLGPQENLYLNPWLDLTFFGENASRSPVMAGLKSALAGTVWVITLVILIALPLGVGTAVYLEEYAGDNRLTRTIEVNIRNLAGVPSIVYGILGLYLFVRLANIGPTVLAAALTLALLILPVVIIASREAIRSVPGTLRQASYGLGATKWQTVRRVVLPNAVPGIVTGLILSVARAIGETAPLLLVGAAAFVPFAPNGLLSNYTVVPVQIYSWVAENQEEFRNVASAAILVLLAVLVVLYALAFYLRRRFERTW